MWLWKWLVSLVAPLGFWGAVIGAAVSAFGAYQAQRRSAQSVSDQMRFQEEMSKTAHQREVADLRAAGLNPILSGTGGAGASTPSGAAYTGVNVEGEGVSTALAAAANEAQVKLAKAQAQNVTMDTAKKASEKRLTDTQQHVLMETSPYSIDAAKWNSMSSAWQYQSQKAQGLFDQSIGEESRWVRMLMEIMRGVRR